MDDLQSGYIGEFDPGEFLGAGMTDIEVIRVTATNVIARGRRYGRLWLLKGIPEDLRGSTSMMRRLAKEFELHSRLDHRSVARVVGFEDIGTLGPCIVMEWIEGRSLAEALRDGNLTNRDRVRIMREITAAVAYIHSRGVVHRDLKPANIMLRRAGGEAVLIDFGLADSDDYAELKQAAGTPGFIAPEQIASGGAEPSDDVYSLGVIMKELCSGYRGLARRCTAPRAKRPDAGELLKLLDRRRRRPRLAAYLAACVALAAVSLATFLTIKSLKRDSRDAQATISALEAENRRDSGRINGLTDSLETVSRKFAQSEKTRLETERYLAAKAEASKTGCAALDAVLRRYDRSRGSKLGQGDYAALAKLNLDIMDELRSTIEKHIQALVPTMTETDRGILERDLTNYWTIEFEKYERRWMARVYPSANAETSE